MNNSLIHFKAGIITSEVPVIVGEAPPSDYPHPGARRMFADGHTDFNGPPRAKPTTAATKVKKARKGPHASPSQQNEPHDEVMSPPQTIRPPPSRPFIVVPKPPLRPAPPPLHPPVMGTKPVMLDIISIPTSDSEEEPLVKPEMEYEGSKGKKRKLKSTAPRTSKKHAPSADTGKKMRGR